MAKQVNTLFWDIGGVLLNNAWDHDERREALAHFAIDEAEFEPRHQPLVPAFEEGRLSLDDYLEQTIFYVPRKFTKDDFKQRMFSLSHALPENLSLARSLAASGKFRMATLNNESRELNADRIATFGLHEIFGLFLSSCYVGLRKPDAAIYRLALDVTQKPAEECCFIDDRAANLEAPMRLGMHVIQMQSVGQLQADLAKIGVA